MSDGPADSQARIDIDGAAAGAAVKFRDVLRYFLVLGTIGFGGPIAAVGYMQRDLVEERGWMDRQDLLDGIALGQTMPGPLAAQVAMWVGFLRRGAIGLWAPRWRSSSARPSSSWRSVRPMSDSRACDGCSRSSMGSAPRSSRSSWWPRFAWLRQLMEGTGGSGTSAS